MATDDPLATEQKIRTQLNIPAAANRVLILGAAPHMDWDWLFPFQSLVLESRPANHLTAANDIITKGLSLIRRHYGDKFPYYFSICEMAFFRAVAGLPRNADLLKNFATEIGDRLGIQGGGLTSPDNFLPHGEAFFRNYLLGHAWLRQVGIEPGQGYCYIPDDFGSDTQLPVAVQALGFDGVSFSRIPPALASSLTASDFVWTAAGGTASSVAHYEVHSYCQGNGIANGNPIENIKTYLGENQPTSPTPYIFVPCGCDFSSPIPNLVDIARDWNTNQYDPGKSPVFVVVGTLGQYLTLTGTYVDPRVKHPYTGYQNLVPRPFQPSPYWTGYYASRPANKILHNRAVRALLGAETFGTIATALQTRDYLAWTPVQQARRDGVAQGWDALAPSTHHDYICGTAEDSVYTGEQLPLLTAAVSIAEGARQTAMDEIATLVAATPQPGEVTVVVFNPIGVDRVSDLTELAAAPPIEAQSVRDDASNLSPVQRSAEGGLLFRASVQSLGYASVYLSSTSAESPDPVSVTAQPDGSAFTLANRQISVTISKSAYWAMTSFHSNGREWAAVGHPTGDFAFYFDQGDIYEFGNEYQGTPFDQVPNTDVLTAGAATVLERGPLRARVRTVVTFEQQGCQAVYVRDYSLVSGESQIRISCTGSAPVDATQGPVYSQPFSVMARFPWAEFGSVFAVEKMTTISRGTAFHWDAALAADPTLPPPWDPPVFVATHDFAVPRSTSPDAFPAVYHEDLPAWAIDASGSLIGCLYRNTPISRHGAGGSDGGTHTHAYAVRSPQDNTAVTLTPLIESRRFQNRLVAVAGNVPNAGADSNVELITLPPAFSLARVVSGTAMITAAKAGQFDPGALVLRVYQPTNASQQVTIALDGYLTAHSGATVSFVTALEDLMPDTKPIPVVNKQITFTMTCPIVTLHIAPPPRL